MSHSKHKKRGQSFWLNEKFPFARKFIVGCIACGKEGYSPKILEPDFADASASNRLAKMLLMENLNCLEVDGLGVCRECAGRCA